MILKEKNALVTGARGGIGRAICARLMKEGATVIATDLTPNGSYEKQDEDGAFFLSMDVTSEASVKSAYKEVMQKIDSLNILVNAAGIEIEITGLRTQPD